MQTKNSKFHAVEQERVEGIGRVVRSKKQSKPIEIQGGRRFAIFGENNVFLNLLACGIGIDLNQIFSCEQRVCTFVASMLHTYGQKQYKRAAYSTIYSLECFLYTHFVSIIAEKSDDNLQVETKALCLCLLYFCTRNF